MPFPGRDFQSSVAKHIKNRPELTLNGSRNSIYCNACSKTIRVTQNSGKSSIESHLSSIKHQLNHKLWSKQRTVQPQIAQLLVPQPNEYFLAVAQLFAHLNVPIKRVNYSAFKDFSRRWCRLNPPDATTLRKYYLPGLYKERIEGIKRAIGDSSIYLQVDETADFQQRPLVSILVGALNGLKPRSYLFSLIRLERSPDSTKIAQLIGDTLVQLWGSAMHYDRFKVLISDQAAYMLKAGRDLKTTFYPHLLHVTCLAHALHNVCQLARVNFPKVEQLVRHFRKAFVKCPRRRCELKDFLDKPLEKFPVDTRWGTWIHFCIFLGSNYDQIRSYVSTIQGERNSSLHYLLDSLEDVGTMDQLLGVSDLHFLCKSIKQLEASGLSILEQREIINDAISRLKEPFKGKLIDLLSKNPSYEEILSADSFEDRLKLRYTPLVSVDVERSFSSVKLIDTARRQNLTDESLMQLAVVYFNAKEDDAIEDGQNLVEIVM